MIVLTLNRGLRCSLFLLVVGGLALSAAEEVFRPAPGTFPPADEAKTYRGELVFVDHINRRGSLRLHVDGHYHEGKLHHFAMLPYGVIRYRGAPAELRDIPIGTVLQGRFYLAPDETISAVPHINPNSNDVTAPPQNHAILLEDSLSLCLREGKAWQLKEVNIKGNEAEMVAQLDRAKSDPGFGGEHRFTLNGSTRIWRGRELLGLADLIKDETWPKADSKTMDQKVQLGLTWHKRYLYQQFHVDDLWLDDAAVNVASERQRQRHIRHIRTRWMPARVDAIDYGKFGQATITTSLFGGMDASLYRDFKPAISGKMAAAENTLRTWWPDHDGMDGRILSVEKQDGEPPLGDSGFRIRFEVPLILEGFRPGRIVRVRPHNWPNVKPPVEERIRNFDDRWPSPDIFRK